MRMIILCFLLLICPAADVGAQVWQKRASVQWSGTPLRESLDRFAEVQGVDYFLDRRVDPSRAIEFEATQRPLETLLPALADSLGLEAELFDGLAYLGPKPYATMLRRLRAEHRRTRDTLPGPVKKTLEKRVSLTIPFLGEPKALLRDLADANGLSWDNLDELPHDLWAAGTVGDMPLGELLSLLLIGFGADYRVQDRRLTLVPISETIRTASARKASRPRTAIPDKHDPAPAVPLARRRFTIRVEDQPLEAVLDMLTERLGLKLDVDEPSLRAKGVTLQSRVGFDVKNAPAAELFRAVLKPLKLEFRLRGETLSVW